MSHRSSLILVAFVHMCAACGSSATNEARHDAPDGGAEASADDAALPEHDAPLAPADAAASRDVGGMDGGRPEEDGPSLDQDAGEPRDAASTASADEVCRELVDGTCEWFKRCSGASASCDQAGPTVAVAARCETTIAAVQAGRARLNADQAEACLQELKSVPCGGPPPTARAMGTLGRDGSVCAGVFEGLAPLGGDCYSGETFASDGCAEGFCSGGCPGSCTRYSGLGDDCNETQLCAPGAFCDAGGCRAYVADGQSCAAEGSRCAAGLFCDEAQRCRPYGREGQACGDSAECATGLVCGSGGDGGGNVCIRPGNAGDPCRTDIGCSSRLLLCEDGRCTLETGSGERCWDERNCPDGEACLRDSADAEFGACGERLAAGAPCFSENDCRDGLWCVNATGTPTCVARLQVGDPCAMGIPCGEGLYCDQRTTECAERGAAGAPCDREQYEGCQDSLLCAWNGTCVAPGDEGDPCTALVTGSCRPGLFCDRTDHVCRPPSGEDGPCFPQDPIESCQEGLYCACDGEPCGGEYDPGAADPGEACLPRGALGAECASEIQCLSGVCAGGRCENPASQCVGPAP